MKTPSRIQKTESRIQKAVAVLLFLFCLLSPLSSLLAQSNVIYASVADSGLAAQSHVNVTATLLWPNPRIYGVNLISQRPLIKPTDTNGVAWFTNVLWGTYRVDVGGSPGTSYKAYVGTNTLGTVSWASLITNAAALPPDDATLFYSQAQINLRLAPMLTNNWLGGGVTIDSNNSFTNTFGGGLTILGLAVQEGYSSTAIGIGSHAEGFYTAATGNASHAEGNSSAARGNISHAAGNWAFANHDNSYVWSDGYHFSSTTNKQFSVHADNGFRFMGGPIEGDGSLLSNLPNQAGVWLNSTYYGTNFSSSLKYALTNAVAGDTIRIGPGVYDSDHFKLTKPLNLIGTGQAIWDTNRMMFIPGTGTIITNTMSYARGWSNSIIENVAFEAQCIGNDWAFSDAWADMSASDWANNTFRNVATGQTTPASDSANGHCSEFSGNRLFFDGFRSYNASLTSFDIKGVNFVRAKNIYLWNCGRIGGWGVLIKANYNGNSPTYSQGDATDVEIDGLFIDCVSNKVDGAIQLVSENLSGATDGGRVSNIKINNVVVNSTNLPALVTVVSYNTPQKSWVDNIHLSNVRTFGTMTNLVNFACGNNGTLSPTSPVSITNITLDGVQVQSLTSLPSPIYSTNSQPLNVSTELKFNNLTWNGVPALASGSSLTFTNANGAKFTLVVNSSTNGFTFVPR